MILARLNSSDLVHSFYGINRRFDVILCELICHFTVSKNISKKMFDKYQPQIQHLIKKISFDVQQLPLIALSTNCFPNLRSVVLSCSNFATVDLNIDGQSAKSIIHSCLETLQACNILPVSSDICHVKNRTFQTVCAAMVRLSIDTCSEQDLLSLCALAPNLTDLRIKQLVGSEDDPNLDTILPSIPPSSSLQQLYISSANNRLDSVDLIGRLIYRYQSSLERLILKISLNSRPDGYHLQQILEPCQRLQKIAFIFSYLNDEAEEIDARQQFQSDWWLDSRRPPVLTFRGSHCETYIVSMPCSLDDYIWFPIDSNDWLLNKNHLGSPDIHFTKQKSIRFSNTRHQLITLDLVHIIGHVFRTPKQELSIPHWRFISADLLIEQVSVTLPLCRSRDGLMCP